MANFLLMMKAADELLKKLKEKAKENGAGATEVEFPFGILELSTEEGSRSTPDYKTAYATSVARISEANLALEEAGSEVRISPPKVENSTSRVFTTTFPVVVMSDQLEEAMSPVVQALACGLASLEVPPEKLIKMGFSPDVVAKAVTEATPASLCPKKG
jgi:hypothetical protein